MQVQVNEVMREEAKGHPLGPKLAGTSSGKGGPGQQMSRGLFA